MSGLVALYLFGGVGMCLGGFIVDRLWTHPTNVLRWHDYVLALIAWPALFVAMGIRLFRTRGEG
jgi:hypothetical protein